MKIPCFPARPVNGGPLPLAHAKSGKWAYEPKVNGWRTFVHTPTGTMFNRHGELLSIANEFANVLEMLSDATNDPAFEWLDCEAFSRRHPLGRGSLILLDMPYAPGNYDERQTKLSDLVHVVGVAEAWAYEQFEPEPGSILAFAYTYQTGDDTDPLLAWPRLQAVNRALKCELFEGLVAKRTDSKYPHQLRSDKSEFPFWMKHRWAF